MTILYGCKLCGCQKFCKLQSLAKIILWNLRENIDFPAAQETGVNGKLTWWKKWGRKMSWHSLFITQIINVIEFRMQIFSWLKSSAGHLLRGGGGDCGPPCEGMDRTWPVPKVEAGHRELDVAGPHRVQKGDARHRAAPPAKQDNYTGRPKLWQCPFNPLPSSIFGGAQSMACTYYVDWLARHKLRH